ncbi:MAG: YggS family pyridoxal phosphate-dependent enzyme [Bacteroidales bacterium]|nr:YggS family pyridoxal phosphate-dependent enzyme [Bacteroidales bacterium]MCF8336550.1 YggS family pyridoxal phosphate-dependent enzyme [Bacteroidales bacterium]
MSIKENPEKIKLELPARVKLIAVSKTKPVETIKEAYDAGHKIFGENKAQELINKQPELPEDIEWHFIGHLQSNKVKYLAPFVSMIHSVDRKKILKEINKEAKKNNRVIDCLLQFHIAEEETKFGLSMEEARELIESGAFQGYENVRIKGVMGMATFTEDTEQVRREFKHLNNIFQTLKKEYFNNENFRELSMGMSGDYRIAIEEGSTIVRVGSLIFGARNTQ